MHYLRSPPYTSAPRPYRTKKANRLQDTWIIATMLHNVRSCSDPKWTKRKFKMVRLVVETIRPVRLDGCASSLPE